MKAEHIKVVRAMSAMLDVATAPELWNHVSSLAATFPERAQEITRILNQLHVAAALDMWAVETDCLQEYYFAKRRAASIMARPTPARKITLTGLGVVPVTKKPRIQTSYSVIRGEEMS